MRAGLWPDIRRDGLRETFEGLRRSMAQVMSEVRFSLMVVRGGWATQRQSASPSKRKGIDPGESFDVYLDGSAHWDGCLYLTLDEVAVESG